MGGSARTDDRRLVGRDREVAELVSAVDALADDGTPAIMQVVGELGIGKSRLLAELGAIAAERGLLVLTGRAGEFESELPFGVFVDALDSHLDSIGASTLDCLDQWLPELASVFPALLRTAGGRTGLVHAERYRTHRAVRALLEELAGSEPVVLLLDDVHWSDAASAELVGHLCNHPPEASVLVALANRPGQTDSKLGATLAAAVRNGRCRRLALSPLSFEQAQQLLLDQPASVREHLYRESGGNPFYLEQLGRGVTGSVTVPRAQTSASGGAVPEAVSAALSGELASLSPPAGDLLRGASVVGDPFDVNLAARAAGQAPAELVAALDELAARELVKEEPTPGLYRFRHPIVRRAVYDSIGPGWRLAAHARTAVALEERGAPANARAHHVERSAAPGDESAVTVLVAAASAAESSAPLTAARWFEAAIRLLPAGADYDDRRHRLTVRMAIALGAAGESAKGHAVLQDAVRQLPTDHPERAAVVAFCANLDFVVGRFDEGRDRLLAELERLGDEPSLDKARIQVEMVAGAGFMPGDDEFRRQAVAALETCRALGLSPLTIIAAGVLSHAEITLGHFAAGLALIDEAAAAFDRLDDSELAERTDAIHWMTTPEISVGRFEDAVRHCRRGIAVFRATGRGHWLVAAMHAQSFALIGLGRLAEAREVAETAVDIGRLGGQVAGLVNALYDQCLIATLSAEHAEAVAAGEEAIAQAGAFPPSVLLALAGEGLAYALLEAGEPAKAKRVLLDAGGGPELPRMLNILRARSFETLTRAALALGHRDEAEHWAGRAEAQTSGEELPLDRVAVNRARAAVLLARGEARTAASLAHEAAQLATAMGTVIEAGRAQLLAGRALAESGDRKQAIAVLETAEHVFVTTGAECYRRQALAELRRLGRRRPPRTSKGSVGIAALTAREREIAAFIMDGKTNREVATSCYISEKTVETHLAHIFAKLGVNTRSALKATLGEELRARSS